MSYPIVIASNSPTAATGYGQQVAQLAPRLRDHGYPVMIASNYGHEGHVSAWDGIKILPRGFDPYSNDTIDAYQQFASAELGGEALVLTLFDVWVFNQPTWDRLPRVASWVPIDHVPAPPGVLSFLAKQNVTPIAMSRFGKREIEAAGIETLYVPHGIERTFHPLAGVERADGSRMTGRELMGIPEDADHVTMINAANKAGGGVHRKAWFENLMAWSKVAGSPGYEGMWLYIHSESRGSMGGFNLDDILRAVDAPMDRVKIVDQFAYRMGIPQTALAAMYTASDLLLATSYSEGFGIPTIEAQACGTPVIGIDFCATPELIGDGWAISGQPWWDAAQKSLWLVPSIPLICEALAQSYDRPRERSQQAIDFASAYYADEVFEQYWKPALAVLA